MGTVLHSEPLAAPQIEPAPPLSDSAKGPLYADGAGIIHGLLLASTIWLLVFALAFLLMW
jgi:hypothetical protein